MHLSVFPYCSPIPYKRIDASIISYIKILDKYTTAKSFALRSKDLSGRMARLGLEKIKPGNGKIRESSNRTFFYNVVLE